MTKTDRQPGLLGKGLYTPSEVAWLVGLTASRVRRWLEGYRFEYETSWGRRASHSRPVLKSDLPRVRNNMGVSFLELVEIRVVSAFLQRNISMATIRRAGKRASEKLLTPHPFAYQKFKTDGKRILAEGKEFGGLLELSHGEYAFPEILNEYLDEIVFDRDTELAKEWWPGGRGDLVVINPHIALGAPVIAGTRVPVTTVIDALEAGETAESLGYWYSLSLRQVRAAIDFSAKRSAA